MKRNFLLAQDSTVSVEYWMSMNKKMETQMMAVELDAFFRILAKGKGNLNGVLEPRPFK